MRRDFGERDGRGLRARTPSMNDSDETSPTPRRWRRAAAAAPGDFA